MSSPPSPSDSVLRDRALRSASLLRERERREAREPSFDSRIEEGELLNIPDHHDDDAVPGPSSVSDHRYCHRRSSVDSHSRAGRSHSRSRSPLRRPPVEPSAETFVVSESKTRLLRKWMVQGIPKSECKSLRHAYAPSFDGDFDLLCPKLDETMVRYWKQAIGKDWRSNLNDFQEKSWQSVQYQVLDSFRPLLQTWNQLPVGSPFLKNMEDSLKLLGAAFAGISKLRRANAMRHVAPDLLPLLKDDRMFSSREFERLFGEKFLTAMVKDADDFEKVKKFAGRSGGPFPTRSENRGSNGRGGHGYRVPDSRYPPTSSGARRGGQGFTPSSTKSQQQSSRKDFYWKIGKLEAKVEQQDSLFQNYFSREKNERRAAAATDSIPIGNNLSALSINGLASSCEYLKMIGQHTPNGFYSIMGLTRMESVYCDFTKPTGNAGFKKFIGFVDVKTAPVYFYVQRDSYFETDEEQPIPFGVARSNWKAALEPVLISLIQWLVPASLNGIRKFGVELLVVEENSKVSSVLFVFYAAVVIFA
ncbi:hypothetical protein DAPPUDRAFT_328557 [Daphnia pulex]|uniref:Uncharacterized protein n=1 Tax=Daphnia pulex TaxID=6669 RepID=E9HE18_DAPPU|nr:hypothetical protein DAPPUDRAFT_328557 [Daphnia pulex]|eukprot:EFX70020.1 hypothetical protein DAPPUDRAFT_328557 [Daphnia pulex]